MHFNVLYKRLSILINDTLEEEKPWLHQPLKDDSSNNEKHRIKIIQKDNK